MPSSRWIAGLLLILVFALAGPSRAEQPQAFIDDVRISHNIDNGKLSVDFRVRHALDARMSEMLDSGLPLRFLYRVELLLPDKMLGDEVAEREFERIFEKDNLKNIYRVTEDDKTREFSTLDEAIKVMGTVEQFRVIRFSKLDPEQSYVLAIKVRLEEFKLPFYIHRILPFFSYWDEETQWHNEPLPATLWETP